MTELLSDDFVFVRHQTSQASSKDKFLDIMMTDVRDKTTAEARRLFFEDNESTVSHSILDGPSGSHAVILVSLVKDYMSGSRFQTKIGLAGWKEEGNGLPICNRVMSLLYEKDVEAAKACFYEKSLHPR